MRTFIGITSGNVQKFVNWWNASFPFDYWFRKKHNIPFNSELHCQSNFIDQYIEYLESKSFKEFSEKTNEEKKKYEPGKNNWLLPKKYTESDIQEMFDNLDIDKL